MLRSVCRTSGIDPGVTFTTLAAQNLPRNDQLAEAYHLPDPLAAELRRTLTPDMRRFADSYGFEVAKWGF